MRRKLLLADDSITVQRVIELTFSDQGLDIVTVGDGTRAIECLQRDRPDIVLADLSMPGPDGYAVAEHVKRESDLVGQTRVVLLTGAFEPVDRERARLLGIDGVLSKPFEPQVAIALVRQLLEQPPLAPPPILRPVTGDVSDWTVGISAGQAQARPEARREQAPGEHNPGEQNPGEPTPRDEASRNEAVAAGYPFEPGTAGARSSPAELDDYFKRLDEALTNAGLMASPAVKDMLAESKGSKGVARTGPPPEMRTGSPTATPIGTPTRTPTGTIMTVGEERPMSVMPAHGPVPSHEPASAHGSASSQGPPSQGPVHITLVDAFSALLAAEQGEGARTTAAASVPFWGTPSQPVVSPESAADARREQGQAAVAPSSAQHAASPGGEASAAPGALSAATVPPAPLPLAALPLATAPPAVTEAQIEAIVRRVVGETADRIIREIANARVLDVAERLVREEIDRLKADTEADSAQAETAGHETRQAGLAHEHA